MKKRTWKALLVLLICLACRQGGVAMFIDDPREYYITLLDYYLLKDYISSNFFYYKDYIPRCDDYNYCGTGSFYISESDTDYNLLAWQEMTSMQIPQEDIAFLAYETSPDTIKLITNSLQKNVKLPKQLAKNKLIEYILTNKRQDILDYLSFMKKCVHYAPISYYSWGEENTANDEVKTLAIYKEGLALLKKEKNLLLRQRYLFQLVRVSRSLDSSSLPFELYQEFFEEKMPKNYLYGRTLAWLADILAGSGQLEKAKSEYAKLYLTFRNIDVSFSERCYIAFRRLKLKNKTQWDKCFAYAKTNEEKSTIWTLASFEDSYRNFHGYDYDSKTGKYYHTYKSLYNSLTFLKEAYQNAPTNINAEILLIREIQKLEQGLYRKLLFKKTKIDSLAYQKVTDKLTQSPRFYEVQEVSIWEKIWKGIIRLFKSFFSLFSAKDQEQITDDRQRKDMYDRKYEEFRYPSPAIHYEKWSEYEDETEKKVIAQFTPLLAFVEQVAQSNQANQPALWHLVAAYLNIMQKDFIKAGKWVQSGKITFGKYKGQNPNILKQLEMFELYTNIENDEKIGVDFEQKLFQFAKNQKDTTVNFDKIFYSRLGQKYLMQGDFAKSVLCFYRARTTEMSGILVEMYANDKQMQALLDLVKKEKPTDFEKYLISTTLNKNQVLEIYATKLGADNRFSEALDLLKQIDETYWLTAMDFTANFGNRYVPQKDSIYHRLSFFSKIDSLNRTAFAHKDSSTSCYMQIGNALYSTPYWAYSESLWKYHLVEVAKFFSGNQYPFNISDSLSTQLYIGKNKFFNRYGTSWLAGQYYQKVMDLDKGEVGMWACSLGMNASIRPLTSFHINEYHHALNYKSDFDLFKKAWLEDYQNAEGAEQILEDCPALKEMR
jgi:hypothetical protein